MTELEQALVRLGTEMQFPETPDLAATVRRRLAAAPPQRGWRRQRGRTFVLAFAVLAVAVGAVMAVPPARSAILEFFGLEGATVQRVEELPKVRAATATALELGNPAPMVDGRPRVKWPFLLLPTALGAPDAAYSSLDGAKLSLVYEPGDGVPRSRYTGVGVLVSEFEGDVTPEFLGKLVDQGVTVEEITVEGADGLWIEGGPHVVLFRGPDGEILEQAARLAGNTLLVERDNLLVRIEGELTRERAIEIAASLEP